MHYIAVVLDAMYQSELRCSLKHRGSLIRNFRTVLNDSMELQLDSNVEEPSVFIREMVLAFGPQERRPLGW